MATNSTAAGLSVFITGATTAVGREVTRQLKAAGHRVTGATSGYENAPLVRADGGIPAYPDPLRAGELRSVMVASKAEVVINLAPQAANHIPQQRSHWDLKLLDDGVAALEDAAQAAGVKFLIHTSYAFVDAHPGDDDETLPPLFEAVQAGEQKALHGAVPGCVLRFGFVYSAESPELVALRDTMLLGRAVDSGPSDSHACWIYAPDAARAVIAALNTRPAGAIFNIVEDHAVSPAAFLSYFAESQGINKPGRAPRFAAWAQPTPEQVALMSLNSHASNSEAKDKLGWQPRFPDYHAAIDDMLLSWRTSADVKEAAPSEK